MTWIFPDSSRKVLPESEALLWKNVANRLRDDVTDGYNYTRCDLFDDLPVKFRLTLLRMTLYTLREETVWNGGNEAEQAAFAAMVYTLRRIALEGSPTWGELIRKATKTMPREMPIHQRVDILERRVLRRSSRFFSTKLHDARR